MHQIYIKQLSKKYARTCMYIWKKGRFIVHLFPDDSVCAGRHLYRAIPVTWDMTSITYSFTYIIDSTAVKMLILAHYELEMVAINKLAQEALEYDYC